MTLTPLPKNFDYHLSPKEKEQVECIVPMHQAKIHLAFRANVLFDSKSYKNCVVALSEHMVTVCSRALFGKNLKLLEAFHLLDVTGVTTIDDKTVVIEVNGHVLRVLSSTCMRFVRNMLRNYVLSAPMMPRTLRFGFQTHDPEQFPPFEPKLSPSQEFQFSYNANCSFYDTTYHHDVARYFHYLMTTGNGVFDMTQLPIDILEDALGESSDARPITASLCFCPYVFGFNCENISKSDIVRASASLVLMNSNVRVLRLVSTGAVDGCKDLAKAMLKNESPGVVYWDLSDNQMDIMHFAQALGAYSEPVVSLKLRNCRMDTYALEMLLSSLIENQIHHGIKQLCISGNEMNATHAQMLATLLKCEDCDQLKVLEIGPVQTVEVVLDALTACCDQLKELHIIDTTITEKGEAALTAFLEAAKGLCVLDLSGCQMSIAAFESVLATVSHNEHIKSIALRFNRVDSRSAVMDVLRRGERKTQQVIAVLEVDESLRMKTVALSLSENGIKEQELKQLLPVIRNMPNLKELWLDGNFNSKMPEVSDALLQLIQTPTLECLSVAGRDGYKLEGTLMPLIKALRRNNTLRRLDISNNEIRDAGLKQLCRSLRRNKTLISIAVDGAKPQDLSSIYEFLDIVASSSSLVAAPYPVDDIYECVAELTGERRERVFETLTHLQSAMEVRLAKNGSRAGIFSRLTLMDDRILNKIIDDITIDMQAKLASVNVYEHLAITQIVGLPLPSQADLVTFSNSKVGEAGDNEGRELYVSKNFMESITDQTDNQASIDDSNFKTLQFNSLLIRRPDSQQKLLKKAKAFAPEFDGLESISEEEENAEEDFSTSLLKPTSFESFEDSESRPRHGSLRIPSSPVRRTVPVMPDIPGTRKRLSSSATPPSKPNAGSEEALNPSGHLGFSATRSFSHRLPRDILPKH